ncbi:MAG: VOC family protein [Candidatus Eremiobacteraeota bacterium]|nr:VOC family protein [Candidatus Eremiobacteraeota bacterium]
MTVSGIGGIFFRADDPVALREWYEMHFGITSADFSPWMQQSGPTVFMPFDRNTDYFPSAKQWMINLRVTDLDAMLAHLRAAGIEIITKAQWDTPQTGRFARLHDPEGNPVELWEPPVDNSVI